VGSADNSALILRVPAILTRLNAGEPPISTPTHVVVADLMDTATLGMRSGVGCKPRPWWPSSRSNLTGCIARDSASPMSCKINWHGELSHRSRVNGYWCAKLCGLSRSRFRLPRV
jgi:hypothetical protein